MSRLKKGIYKNREEPFKEGEQGLFGLAQWQAREDAICREVSCYNPLGEELGSGEMSVADIERISSELEVGECFVIAHSAFSSFRFLEQQESSVQKGESVLSIDAPGTEYVVEQCQFVLVKGSVYFVDRYETYLLQGNVMCVEWNGQEMLCNILSKEGAKKLIMTAALVG